MTFSREGQSGELWPVGPNTARHSRIYKNAVRPIYQGSALRWMNGWAFGPNHFPNFCMEQNRPAGSAEQRCGLHRFCAAYAPCAGHICFTPIP